MSVLAQLGECLIDLLLIGLRNLSRFFAQFSLEEPTDDSGRSNSLGGEGILTLARQSQIVCHCALLGQMSSDIK